ncbi:hypothetical protein [Flavobacterium sp. MK4S-17]|uniref:hypothetical protein n=1 Tax=Flavobacterium sp. MK4S-17 TaxID=2543737 RepID=UPI00135AB8F0|nr:hypothetical protein [Flavobacterium sp. MK4S-17]
MEKNNYYKGLTDKELIKRKDLLKGVVIGFGIVFLIGFAILIYLFATKGLKEIPMGALIPFFAMPLTFIPILINLNLLLKEIKTRNL